MTKYDGIEVAEARLAPTEEITVRAKARRGGYFTGLFVRFLIAAVIFGAVFGVRMLDFEVAQKAVGYVKQAVCYDMLGEADDEGWLLTYAA